MSRIETNPLFSLDIAVEQCKERFLAGLAIASDRAAEDGDMFFSHSETVSAEGLSVDEVKVAKFIIDTAAERVVNEYPGQNVSVKVISQSPIEFEVDDLPENGYQNTVQVSWALD